MTGDLETGIGNKNGYKFVLNVHEEEYCQNFKNIWYGVGLHATFHDRDFAYPELDDDEGTMYLSPGFEYNVLVRPTLYKRHTENIGRCINHYPVYLFQTTNYNRYLCETQCLMELVWRSCKCPYLEATNFRKAFAKHIGVRPQDIPFDCWRSGESILCVSKFFIDGTASLVLKHCKHCKQPCQERKYKLDISASKFPPSKNFRRFHTKQFNFTSDSFVEKNIVVLNIYYENNLVNIVEETLQYSLTDLFIYIGNNIGLFLGMSFVSFAEIWYYPSYVIHMMFKKWVNIRKILNAKKRINKKIQQAEKNRRKHNKRASNIPLSKKITTVQPVVINTSRTSNIQTKKFKVMKRPTTVVVNQNN